MGQIQATLPLFYTRDRSRMIGLGLHLFTLPLRYYSTLTPVQSTMAEECSNVH